MIGFIKGMYFTKRDSAAHLRARRRFILRQPRLSGIEEAHEETLRRSRCANRRSTEPGWTPRKTCRRLRRQDRQCLKVTDMARHYRSERSRS
jgi:hypothetical protein